MSNLQLLQHALLLLAALFVTSAVQIGSVRFSRGSIGVVASLFLGFAAGVLVLLAGEIPFALWGSGGQADNICLGVSNAVLFVCSWYFYFHFINIGEASLRIRILREVAAAEGCQPDQLLAAYNSRVVLEARIERLVTDGQLLHREGRYHAGRPRMVLVAKVFAALRWLLLGEVSASEQGS
ncbi:MAG: hypothetical protein WCI38_00445 [Chthoniobacterales bacterium]|jgi:hypothetical protein